MEVGLALPTMAAGFDGPRFRRWCALIDEGPFSSVSTGERINFVNPELVTTLAAAAALTERVDIMANIVVAPLHRPAMLAKQLATIDVLSEGRLIVGLGVGGRPQDYRAAGVPFARRHEQVDALALELRRLWSGEPPFDDADPVGPATVRPAGPRLVAGAMGVRSLARASQWADGVTGFSLTGADDEIEAHAVLARAAWIDAGRDQAPWLGTGTFCVLGIEDSLGELRRFAARYLGFFGSEVAHRIAESLTVATPEALIAVLDGARRAGIDEFTVVPGTWDLRCAEAIREVVAEWRLRPTGAQQGGGA